MVLRDGVLVDDKGVLTIVPEGGDRCVGQSATLERALTTEALQCLVKGRGGVDFTVIQPQEHFLLGIQEGQAWGCIRCNC